MKIAYIRVSTQEQNLTRQEELMKQLEVDKIFVDKASGKNTNREQLKEMMSFVREGDTVVVESISRFARCTRDLLELVDQLKHKGVHFVSKKEAIDTNTPTGQFMLTIFGAVAELERQYILSRQAEGIAIAKKEGKYKGRKPKPDNGFETQYKRWQAKEITIEQALAILNISKTTWYRKSKSIKKRHIT